jgi:hypothetical protein
MELLCTLLPLLDIAAAVQNLQMQAGMHCSGAMSTRLSACTAKSEFDTAAAAAVLLPLLQARMRCSDTTSTRLTASLSQHLAAQQGQAGWSS